MIISAQGSFMKQVVKRPQFGFVLNGTAKVVSDQEPFPIGAQIYVVTNPLTNSGPGDESWDVAGGRIVAIANSETVFDGMCSGTVTIRTVDGKPRVVALALGGVDIEGNPFALRDIDVTNPEPGFIEYELAQVAP